MGSQQFLSFSEKGGEGVQTISDFSDKGEKAGRHILTFLNKHA